MTTVRQRLELDNAEIALWRGSVDEKLGQLHENHKSLRDDVGELKAKMENVQIKLENVAVKAGLFSAVGAILGSALISAFGVVIWYVITKVVNNP